MTPRRRRLRLPRASTTPSQVRLIRAGLVAVCLGWGALAALMVGQHASPASDATSISEPLSLDAQQMYQSLADADVTVSTNYLTADQAVFADSAAAGSGAFTGLEIGVAVLALAMAAGCAWGLSQRLAEYR
jgi:hypothetical protein